MEKSGEQPPQQQGEPKRGAEEMSLDAPMPPIFGNANQSEGDVFKVRLHMSPVCITPMQKKCVSRASALRTLKFEAAVFCAD